MSTSRGFDTSSKNVWSFPVDSILITLFGVDGDTAIELLNGLFDIDF